MKTIALLLVAVWVLLGCRSLHSPATTLIGRISVSSEMDGVLSGGAVMELDHPVEGAREVQLVNAPQTLYAQYEIYDGATVEVLGRLLATSAAGSPRKFEVSTLRLVKESKVEPRSLDSSLTKRLDRHPAEIDALVMSLRRVVTNDRRAEVTAVLCKEDSADIQVERAQWVLFDSKNSLRSKMRNEDGKDLAVFERLDTVDAYIREYVVCIGNGAGSADGSIGLFPLTAPRTYGCFTVWLEDGRACPLF